MNKNFYFNLTTLIRLLLFLSLPLFLMSERGECTIKTAIVTSGDWAATSSWSTGTIPTYGDTMIIPLGKRLKLKASKVTVHQVLR